MIRGREFIGDPILFGYNTITSWANNVELFKKISKPSSFSLFFKFWLHTKGKLVWSTRDHARVNQIPMGLVLWSFPFSQKLWSTMSWGQGFQWDFYGNNPIGTYSTRDHWTSRHNASNQFFFCMEFVFEKIESINYLVLAL